MSATSKPERSILFRLRAAGGELRVHSGETPEARPETATHCEREKLRRPRNHSATNQARIGNRVMRGAVRTRADKAGALIENSGDAVNFRRLQSLFESKWRQDGRHPFGQHGFARAGRADHENVMSARAGDLNGTLGGLLSTNVFEVDVELL